MPPRRRSAAPTPGCVVSGAHCFRERSPDYCATRAARSCSGANVGETRARRPTSALGAASSMPENGGYVKRKCERPATGPGPPVVGASHPREQRALRNVDRSWSQGDWWPRRARGRDSGWCAPSSRSCSRPAGSRSRRRPVRRARRRPAPTRSSSRTARRAARGANGTSRAPATRASRASRRTCRSTGARGQFKVSTPATSYRIDIYRMGYYGGDGARKVATITLGRLPQTSPRA